MNTKTILGTVAAILILGGGAYFYSKNNAIPVVGAVFACVSEDHYLRVSNDGIADVIDFGSKKNPIPSRIYVDTGVDTEGHTSKGKGVFTVYHDDQYDPVEQKAHIPALYDCTFEGKNVFEIYERSRDKFQEVINTSKRNDAPSDI